MIGPEDVVVILGRRGTGKTTISRSLQRGFPRIVVIDRLREYYNARFSDPDATSVSRDFKNFSRQLLENRYRPKFKIIFQPDRENDSVEFNEALNLIYEMGDCLLVVEDVQIFSSSHSMPSHLREIILTGRHKKLALFVTTQRPGELHKTLLSQANHVFIGPLHEANDIKYLSAIMGRESENLLDLGDHEFFYFRPGHGLARLKNHRPI